MSSFDKLLLSGLVLSAVVPVHAQLLGRNLGGGAEYEAYYSPALDVTFLANAGGNSPMNSWDAAKAWAAGLNVYGVTGWRLPTATLVGSGSGAFQIAGTNELARLNAEMLSHPAGDPLQPGPFTNFATNEGPYWIDADPAEDTSDVEDYAWHYVFLDHYSGRHPKSETLFLAWAVKTGDVVAVPEPSTYALWLAGLAWVGTAAWRRRCGHGS